MRHFPPISSRSSSRIRPGRLALLALTFIVAGGLSVLPAANAQPHQAQPHQAQAQIQAQAEAVAPADAQAVRSVISDQVAAFRRDDWRAAFAHASPSIQSRFGTPETFRSMVLGGYRAVAEPSVFEFRESVMLNGNPAQVAYVIGPDGFAYEAVYFMERQADGTWRISGVSLNRLAGVSS